MSSRSAPRPGLRLPEAVRGYAVLVGGELVSKALTAVGFAYLARSLGAEAYGQLEVALAFVMVLTLVVDCGFGAYGAREIARDAAAAPRLISEVVGLRIAFAVPAIAVLAVVAVAIDKPWSARLLLLLFALPLLLTSGLLTFVFQGWRRMHVVALANLTRWLVFAVGSVLAVGSPEHLDRVPLIEAAAIATAITLGAGALVRSGIRGRWTFEAASVRLALHESLPIGASGLVWAARIYLPTILLGLQGGDAVAGWFGAAHRLAVALHTFVWLYCFNLLPLLSRASLAPAVALRPLIGTSVRVTGWGAVALGILGDAFAEPLVRLVYGPGYEEAIGAFSILLWFVAIALLSGNYRFALIACGHQRLELVGSIAGLVVGVTACIVLVPWFGPRGAAVGLVLSEILIFGLAVFFVRSYVVPMPSWRYLRRPLVVAAALTVAAQLVAPGGSWAVGAVLGAALAVAAASDPGLVAAVRSILARRE